MPHSIAEFEVVDERLAALAEPTRRRLVEQLASGEQCVCDLQVGLGAAQSRLSFHLKKLKEAGLVRSRRAGRWIYYDLEPAALRELGGWITGLGSGRVRVAEPADLSAALALLEVSELPTDGFAELVERETGAAWVIAEGGSIRAVAGLERYGAAGLLRSVAVAPDHRREGLGRRLVDRALREARCLDQTGVFLLTTTAERWFSHLGFDVVPRSGLPEALLASDEVCRICPASAVVMHRDPHATEEAVR